MSKETMRLALEKLASVGWDIEYHRSAQTVPLPLAGRYSELPEDHSLFLSHVSSCVSPDGKRWFVTLPEFAGTTDTRYAWNEWEKISLASYEGNAAWEAETRAFWTAHVPVLLSIVSSCSYLAYDLTNGNAGKIVYGCGIHWEEPTVYTESFTTLLSELAEQESVKKPSERRRRLTREDRQRLRELLAECFVIPEEPGDIKITVTFLDRLQDAGVITDRCELIDGVIIKKEPRITPGDYRRCLEEHSRRAKKA